MGGERTSSAPPKPLKKYEKANSGNGGAVDWMMYPMPCEAAPGTWHVSSISYNFARRTEAPTKDNHLFFVFHQ